MIIERPLVVKRLQELRKWTLLYGRRKTGKTFLVRTFLPFDEYFFVKNDKTILSKDNASLSYETFLAILQRALHDKKTVVVDEFHRLGNDFFDVAHAAEKQGKLILISSTLYLSQKLISSKSALLGLFAEVPLGLISLQDCLAALQPFSFSQKERLELAILLREPLAIDYFDPKQKARTTIATIILSSLRTIPALIGEIFLEEERDISAIYEGILRAVALGKVGSGEISNYLFSKKLTKKDDPSVIQQYLHNLVSFGILKRIEIFLKKRFVYKLASPLARIYYYADERYNLSERKVTEEELIPLIDELMPKIVEDTVREFLAERYGLRESIVEAKDFDIDGCLLKFKKPEIIIETKWKRLHKDDILRSEQTLKKIAAPKKILFVQDKKNVHSSATVLDVEDLASGKLP